MEARCEGGQGPPRAVMPRKKKKKISQKTTLNINALMYIPVVIVF
jgi:hypothetical protein